MPRRLAQRILLVGWDAADWAMIRPLIEQGLMPTLKRLMDRGVSGKLATIRPILSPMLWNSIATGKRADKHGICGFAEPMPDGSGIRPVTSTSRKTKAIWNILSQTCLTSNVVGWFASHPAEPIRGTVVTDHYVHPPSPGEDIGTLPPGVCHPGRLRKPLSRLKVDPHRLDAQSLLPFIPRAAEIDQAKDDRLRRLSSLVARASSVHAAACAIMVKEPWDFMAIYYDAIDQFGHHFMPYHPPAMEGVSDHDAEIYKEVMVGCYRFHDMMLEALLHYAGDETTVLVVSDHGFHSGSGRDDTDGFKNPTNWHRPFGVACMAGPGVKKGEMLYGASLLDVTPTILTLFGLPIGADMDGRPWLEVFDEELRPQRIPSWDDVDGESGMHGDDLREDPVEASEAIEHLVKLGYLEAPSDDVQETVHKTKIDLKRNLAIALSDGNRVQEAVAAWQELIQLVGKDSPNRFAYRAELARCYMRLLQERECEDLLADLFAESPDNVGLHVLRGQWKLHCREPREALDCFQRARELSGDRDGLCCLFGQAFVQLSQWDDAETAFQHALEQDDEIAVAFNGLASVAIARRQFDKAIDFALRAVGLVHQFPAAHCNLGTALVGAGMADEAIQAFETCLAMAPRILEAHRRLATLYKKDNRDLAKARHHERMAEMHA